MKGAVPCPCTTQHVSSRSLRTLLLTYEDDECLLAGGEWGNHDEGCVGWHGVGEERFRLSWRMRRECSGLSWVQAVDRWLGEEGSKREGRRRSQA